jgi:hypothetical protein
MKVTITLIFVASLAMASSPGIHFKKFQLAEGSSSFSCTLSPVPVARGSVSVNISDGGYEKIADSNGKLKGAAASGTIDYSTGAVDLTLSSPSVKGEQIEIVYKSSR